MADAGVVRDANRLPWLEPYRAPPRKKSNRRAGVTTVMGVVGLMAVVTLLMRDEPIIGPAVEGPQQSSVVLPAPRDLQPPVVITPLKAQEEPTAVADNEPARLVRPAVQPRRKIKALPTRAAYRKVMRAQGDAPAAPEASPLSDAALAIAAMPVPAEPPRPAVNPAAQIVRGKTVQLGVFHSRTEAEAAWNSAIRDYTYLVTMPKSIEPISLRSKRYYRLQLGTPSKQHAKQLCTNLKSIGRACTVA